MFVGARELLLGNPLLAEPAVVVPRRGSGFARATKAPRSVDTFNCSPLRVINNSSQFPSEQSSHRSPNAIRLEINSVFSSPCFSPVRQAAATVVGCLGSGSGHFQRCWGEPAGLWSHPHHVWLVSSSAGRGKLNLHVFTFVQICLRLKLCLLNVFSLSPLFSTPSTLTSKGRSVHECMYWFLYLIFQRLSSNLTIKSPQFSCQLYLM